MGGAAQGIPQVVVAAALFERGESSTWLAALGVARLMPYLVCSPHAGVIAARVEPRTLLAAVGLARAGVAAAIGGAVAAGAAPALLVALVFALVTAGCPAYPALMRVLRDTTAADRLDRVTVLAAGVESAAFWAGPALGGLLLVVGGTGAVAVATAMALLAAVLSPVVPLLRRRPDDEPMPAGLFRAVVRQLVRPAARPAIVSVMAINVLGGLLAVLLVRLPADLDFGGRREFGLLTTAQGFGAVLAFGFTLGSSALRRRVRIPLVAAVVAAVVAASGWLPSTVLACTTFGAAALAAEALATNVLCRVVPSDLVAPAFGMLDAWMVAAMMAGSVAAPAVVGALGVRAGIVLTSVVVGALSVLAMRIGDVLPGERDEAADGGPVARSRLHFDASAEGAEAVA
jgi:hypothetical protein